jgi:hypothetical protein
LVDSLWCQGIPTDLIPSSEIGNKSLYVDKEGWICYGAQRYSAVILYHPEFEKSTTADFFKEATEGKTILFRMGDWTKDFNGKDFDGNRALPKRMIESFENKHVIMAVKDHLEQQNFKYQTPAIPRSAISFDHSGITPQTTGYCRLVDGTVIHIAGTEDVSGDPIQTEFEIKGCKVLFDASGVTAVRLNENDQVQALVAGGLKSFKTGNFEIYLDQRVDIALWITKKGKWEGAIQGWSEKVPPQLLSITKDWVFLNVPVPFAE